MEKTIQSLLELGFRDDTFSIDQPQFILDIKNFELQYNKGVFSLEGDGGYDDNGMLELNHFQIKDIKPLFKLLTGDELKEVSISFDYQKWQDKLKADQDQRNANYDRLGLLSDFPKFPGKELGFLEALEGSLMKRSATIEWHEQEFLRNDE